MFHEVATPFAGQPLRHAALAGITRAMARLAAGAAARVFVSIPAWGDALRRLCPRVRPPRWLPVPSTLEEHAGVAPAARERFAPAGRPLVGHFGTYGLHVATMLTATLTELAALAPDAAVLLVGRGSAEFAGRLVSARPELAGRVAASGGLSGADAAAHLKACDLLIQPFPDGVSSRRTSAMARVIPASAAWRRGCHANGVATSWNITHTGAARSARAASHAANPTFIPFIP